MGGHMCHSMRVEVSDNSVELISSFPLYMSFQAYTASPYTCWAILLVFKLFKLVCTVHRGFSTAISNEIWCPFSSLSLVSHPPDPYLCPHP